MILLDNYDSFTYNLVEYFRVLGVGFRVYRNDQISLAEIELLKPERMVISPGPGSPSEAGISCAAIRTFAGRIPILGVCLGHQCIAEVFGGRVVRSAEPVHGKTSVIHYDDTVLFSGLPNPFEAMRYHSLIVERESLPDTLRVSASTDDGIIMGLQHRQYTVMGVQFHPESILTPCGMKMLANFLAVRGGTWL
ncbi:aminodeoxychorismate/anthranilate synthase component II [candidate division KSB1 bacterium]|nr:MAG: aminodeoxychorismate/anthranilate synthase component II [candidate division KSB1 bacterium]